MSYHTRVLHYKAVNKIKMAFSEQRILGHTKTMLNNTESDASFISSIDERRELLVHEVQEGYDELRQILDSLQSEEDGAEKWRRLMELVDGNDTWDAASVLSHFSMDPKNETARRGVKISPEDLMAGDVIDTYGKSETFNVTNCRVKRIDDEPFVSLEELDGCPCTYGINIMAYRANPERFSWGEIRLVERNGVKVQPGMAQWEWDIINEVVPPKPELPTEPGTIFRVLEFDGKPFETLAHVDADGDFVTITVDYWPNEEEWIKYADRQRITKFELVDVVTKESA